VRTADLRPGAVTGDRLAAGAVTSGRIADGAVGEAKLGAGIPVARAWGRIEWTSTMLDVVDGQNINSVSEATSGGTALCIDTTRPVRSAVASVFPQGAAVSNTFIASTAVNPAGAGYNCPASTDLLVEIKNTNPAGVSEGGFMFVAF
jgi:hypothetical protein